LDVCTEIRHFKLGRKLSMYMRLSLLWRDYFVAIPVDIIMVGVNVVT